MISKTTIFRIFLLVTTWAEKALADGKISVTEVMRLVGLIAEILDVPIVDDIRRSTPKEPAVKEDKTNEL